MLRRVHSHSQEGSIGRSSSNSLDQQGSPPLSSASPPQRIGLIRANSIGNSNGGGQGSGLKRVNSSNLLRDNSSRNWIEEGGDLYSRSLSSLSASPANRLSGFLPKSPSGSMLLPSRSRSFFQTRRWASLLSADLWKERERGGLQVSPQDDRQYRIIRLPNNLKAIIVSDSTTEKAAAALSVRVGASHDPIEAPGTAHFLEHMLFLGTEKYPRENTYKDMVNSNGGTSNASTSMDLTLYKFEVAAEHYEKVLDVFSQFFICPLFTESATEREMKAVDAENSKNLVNDGRRLLQITKAVADPEHPWSKFSTGNLATLRDHLPEDFSIGKALLTLYEEHYYASKMALALVGPQSLDSLEKLVYEKFGGIRDKQGEADSAPPAFSMEGRMANGSGSGGRQWEEEEQEEEKEEGEESEKTLSVGGKAAAASSVFRNPFPRRYVNDSLEQGLDNLTLKNSSNRTTAVPIIRIVPLRDKRELQLSWALPPVRELYMSPPTRLLSHLVGHEGEGSIFSVLHALGWASGVNAGVGTSQEDFCLFEVTVSLTEEGQKHWQDIAALVFHYLRLIGQAAPEELSGMWDEMRAISSTSFRFQQKASEYAYATDLSRRLQYFQDKHVLSGGHLYEELDVATLDEEFLSRLTEENVSVFLSCKDNQPFLNQKEKWYGVEYGLEHLPSNQVRQWSSAHFESLHLPRPNPFIPEDFDILATSFEPPSASPIPPKMVRSTSILDLWYKLDESYKQPRANIILLFNTPLVQRDPAAAELLVRYIDHALSESTYDAVVAGLGWSISTSTQGLSLRFTGFSHKIQTLLHKVLESLLTLSLQEGLFNISKEKAIDSYKNIRLARPDEHCAIYLNLLLTEGRWDWRDKLQRVQNLELEDLAGYHRQFLDTSTLKLGVFGNVSPESALGLAEQVERLLRRNPKFSFLTPSLQPITRIAMLDKGIEYRLRAKVPNDEDINSAVYCYFQAGLLNPTEQARLMLLAQILKEPTFTQLRTREQLGYVVASGIHLTWMKSMVGGLSFRILSKTHSPEQIMSRVDEFLGHFGEAFLSKQAEEFERHKASLITNLLEPPKKLVTEVSMHWNEILNETYEWKRNQLYAEAVRETSLQELVELFHRLVLHKESRRKLSVMIYGKHHAMPALEKSQSQQEEEEEEEGVVNLSEGDWLSFRQSRPLFPYTSKPLSFY